MKVRSEQVGSLCFVIANLVSSILAFDDRSL